MLKKLKAAVTDLSPKELAQFRNLLERFDASCRSHGEKAVIRRIQRGEKEFRDRKTRIVDSLSELSVQAA